MKAPVLLAALSAAAILSAGRCGAQSVALPWSGHGHDPQHSGISQVAAQPMNRIRWSMPVDLNPVYSGTTLYIHYGSPVITRQNTLVMPVKTGAYDSFRIEARNPADGAVKWILPSDYSLPSTGWVAPCGIALTPKNRVCFPGGGGTVQFRDDPDAATGATGRLAFFGIANYEADPAAFNAAVKITSPITADRYGNLFFGFQVDGTTAPVLTSGIARIAEDGTGSWVSAATAAADASVTRPMVNCAPALSLDQKTLYTAVSTGSYSGGYLVSLDSRTLAPINRVRLKDVANPLNDSILADDGTSTPTVGPDGDVFMGVLEAPFFSHRLRGWLLHFDKTLSQTKTPGSFGWDNTPSVVPASMVPAYTGPSSYLLLAKYNDYASTGGGGANKLAILDPAVPMSDFISGVPVMREVHTILGPTPDAEFPGVPGAVREWCINTAAVDPITKCAIVNSEDGKAYRWDFTTNTFTQTITLTSGIGEAYTPTVIGVDGTCYAISNATLFALGQ